MLTKEAFLENLYQIELKRLKLNEIAKSREAEEQALADEYKVNEVNTKRANIQAKYQSQANAILAEIQAIQSENAKASKADL